MWPKDRAATLSCKADLFRLHGEGGLEAWVDAGPEGRGFCGLESVADAVDYMLTGQALGKVVVAL